MEWLHEMIFEMDWKQFIPSLIATVVGIFGPFWIQRRIEKTKQKTDALDRVEQLKGELNGVLKTIQNLNDEEERYIDPVKTPVWTGLQNTNESSLLSVLRKKPKSKKVKKNKKKSSLEEEGGSNSLEKQNDVTLIQDADVAQQAIMDDFVFDQNENWYNAVYALYGRIEEYNKWWNLYSTQRAAGREARALHNEKECISNVKEKLCSRTLQKDGKAITNKAGIPYLLALLDVVIAVNTPLIRRLWNAIRGIFKTKTNKQTSK